MEVNALANTLAYYDTAIITAVKSFIVQAPEGSIKVRRRVSALIENGIEKLA